MTNKLFLLFILGSLLFISCSKKTLVITGGQPVKTTLAIEEINFDYFHGKARLVVRDANKEQEVKANIRIRKDSVIWMTFSVIGVQGGRALINKDSITVVSTLAKEYYVFDYKTLSQKFNFPVTYDVIQAALLGNPIIPRNDTDVVEILETMFLLKQHTETVDVANYINSPGHKIEKVELKEPTTKNSLVINYSNFQPVADKLFAYNATISVFYKSNSGVVNTTVTFEYNKAEVGDKELRFPFNIPKKYERK
ncbi:MAG: DUF4292 domain-containing protein [Cyclobacteriaceae bacterium]|jgi:hypothetical protein|nr:DUF4292 domain-containing protein [Cyclobacteriaceae bacterium]